VQGDYRGPGNILRRRRGRFSTQGKHDKPLGVVTRLRATRPLGVVKAKTQCGC